MILLLSLVRKQCADNKKNNEKIVADYKNGKENLLMYMVGIIMRSFPKKFPPEKVKSEFIKQLK